MDPEAYKKNNKPETGAKRGVYKHPQAPDSELHAGTFAAADAFVRQGWVYDRPLPPRTEKLKQTTETNPAKAETKETK